MSRVKNKELLGVIKEYFTKYSSFVITDYKGMSVETISKLRSKFDSENVKYKIFKNKLVKIVLQEYGIKDLDNYLIGPSAFVFSDKDLLSSSKILANYIRTGDLTVKAGYTDNSVVDNNYLIKLSKIPSKEVVLANLISVMSVPIRNLINVMNAPIRDLTFLLKEIHKKKNNK